MRDYLRTVRLRPYRRDCGPSFTLTTWDTGCIDWRGASRLGYELRQHDKPAAAKRAWTAVIFSGEDFGASPLHAIDSDRSVGTLLGFLTLRPGDTDADYFADYTDAQREFCDQHAEALSCEAMHRFGEEC